MAIIEQEPIATPLITRLNESRGVVDIDFISVPPETRINIPTLAGRIGTAMSTTLPEAPDHDSALAINYLDFTTANLDLLNRGLIIKPENPLYKNPESNRVAIMMTLPTDMFRFEKEGFQHPKTGVAVGRGEFPTIETHPRPLALRAKATTLDALDDDVKAGLITRKQAHATAMRAGGHALESKLERLDKLDRKFLGQSALLLSLSNDAKLVWRTAYLGKNLTRKRLEADELIHEIAEIACNNLNFGEKDTNATHRVIASRLYRRGSAAELARSWRQVTAWARYYLNAKRGKINQAHKGSKSALVPYQRYLEAGAVAKAT